MKVPAATLATLLLMAICSPAEANLSDSSVAVSSQTPGTVSTICCFSYLSRPMPRRLIASTYRTSSKCSLPAVVLVTKKGTKLCADPQEPWVQKHLKHFQMLKY